MGEFRVCWDSYGGIRFEDKTFFRGQWLACSVSADMMVDWIRKFTYDRFQISRNFDGATTTVYSLIIGGLDNVASVAVEPIMQNPVARSYNHRPVLSGDERDLADRKDRLNLQKSFVS